MEGCGIAFHGEKIPCREWDTIKVFYHRRVWSPAHFAVFFISNAVYFLKGLAFHHFFYKFAEGYFSLMKYTYVCIFNCFLRTERSMDTAMNYECIRVILFNCF